MSSNKINTEVILNAINQSQLLKIPADEAQMYTLEDLKLDSLDLISLSMLLEDQLKLTIDVDTLQSNSTLADLIQGLHPIQE